jgi:Tat protein translocase TatB subunit
VFEIGVTELMLIGLIALLVLGPERLPPLVRSTGRWIGRAQRMVRELRTQLENETGYRELNQFGNSWQRTDLAVGDGEEGITRFPGAGANAKPTDPGLQDPGPRNTG